MTAVVAVELAVCLFVVSGRLSRIEPPTTDARRLDPLTAADLEPIRVAVSDGGGKEWRALAEAYLGNGYYVAAEQCFHQATVFDTADVQSLYGQGFCLERVGHTTAAIEVFKRAVDHPLADRQLIRTCWYQIGRGFLREENSDDAEAAFRRIAEFPPAAYQLSKLLIRSGRAAEAMPILQQQLTEMPNSLKFLQLQMRAAEELGDEDLVSNLRDREDRAQYQLVLEYGQSFIGMFASRYGLSALLSRAMRLKTQGTLMSRKSALARPLKLIRENQLWQYRSVLIAAAHVEFGLGNLNAAKQLIEEIEGNTQGGIDVLELRAMVAAADRDHDSAYEFLSRAVTMKPTAHLFQLLSQNESRRGQVNKQLHHGRANLSMALKAWQIGENDEALAALQRAEAVLSTNELWLFYLGETHRVAGNREKAILAYRECLKQNPDHGRALDRLAQLNTK